MASDDTPEHDGDEPALSVVHCALLEEPFLQCAQDFVLRHAATNLRPVRLSLDFLPQNDAVGVLKGLKEFEPLKSLDARGEAHADSARLKV